MHILRSLAALGIAALLFMPFQATSQEKEKEPEAAFSFSGSGTGKVKVRDNKSGEEKEEIGPAMNKTRTLPEGYRDRAAAQRLGGGTDSNARLFTVFDDGGSFVSFSIFEQAASAEGMKLLLERSAAKDRRRELIAKYSGSDVEISAEDKAEKKELWSSMSAISKLLIQDENNVRPDFRAEFRRDLIPIPR